MTDEDGGTDVETGVDTAVTGNWSRNGSGRNRQNWSRDGGYGQCNDRRKRTGQRLMNRLMTG